MTSRIVIGFLALFSGWAFSQTITSGNEQATSSAEAERKIMESTLQEVLKIIGEDSARGKMFLASQNEWVQYVKAQAKADADGVSGEAKYPQAYFQTMRELTRYRTRVLEGCLSRLKAEQAGSNAALASREGEADSGGRNSSAKDWKAEVGDEPLSQEATLYEAEIEGVSGLVAGQWRDEELWRGIFIADRGDSMMLYGGKMERGGIVFEAWQEGTRIGRGFVRDEEGDLRGRFFDERRRESPMVLKAQKRPAPVSYSVSSTPYSGLLGTDDLQIGLEWHDTRFVRGSRSEETVLSGHNYAQGKLFLEEREPGADGRLLGCWSLTKKSGRGSTRWIGLYKPLDSEVKAVDFGR